ncbi:MAG: glycyl radical protein [Smithellaceae bacterium]
MSIQNQQAVQEKVPSRIPRPTLKTVRNIRRGYVEEENTRGVYRPEIRLAIERSRYMTESYKQTEGEPWVLRRAKALENVLNKMTIYIRDGEFIVGNGTESPHHLAQFVDSNWKSVQRVVNKEEGWTLLDDAGRAEYNEICEYWKGKSIMDIHASLFTEEMKRDFKYDGTFLWSPWSETDVPNYEKILQIGLRGIIAEVEKKQKEIDDTMPLDYLEQREFLEAGLIGLRSVIRFAERFAAKAREMAKSEKDAERKQQLLAIADACDHVPAYPARTFHEALQSYWFIHLITRQIEFVTIGIGVRMDVLFNPFYVKDKAEGRLTETAAKELFEELWLKFEDLGQFFSPLLSGVYAGAQLIQTAIIGGVDAEGKDVTNELSYLILDVVNVARTLQGSLGLRYHKGTPKDLLMKSIDVIGTGLGYPAFFNDDVHVPLLQKWGYSLADARNYTIRGCVYINIPGKNLSKIGGGYICPPKILWWALHQGKDPKTGEQRGAKTSDPAKFKSVEDVMDAYLEQFRFFFKKHARLHNMNNALSKRYLQRPFLSTIMDDCIERGQECRSWSYPGGLGHMILLGPTNVANSLAALKKVVFDDKQVSMKEFVKILDNNWEGQEAFRQMVINKVPKFGNDDDYVDTLCAEVHKKTEDVIEEFLDNYGYPLRGDGSGVAATYGLALDCAATPDGRKDGDPYADATLSPSVGTDKKGPMAVIASCGKVDTVNSYNQLLNQKFLPSFLQGEENKEVFYSYLRTWGDQGISHIQFNVCGKETLLDAQENPDKHTDLIVRIAGYSAYFIDLSKGLQDNIIARTEQSF